MESYTLFTTPVREETMQGDNIIYLCSCGAEIHSNLEAERIFGIRHPMCPFCGKILKRPEPRRLRQDDSTPDAW